MKLIEFKEYNNVNTGRVLNKKKIAVFIILMFLIVISVTFSIIYVCNSKFRDWADIHILMKTVNEGTLPYIELEQDENVQVYAFDKYVTILNNNKLDIYNTSAKKMESLEVNISNPIYKDNGKYLVIAEKEKQKVYLISGTKKIWENNVEGTILRASVNENGYVSVICEGTTYKSIITIYGQDGKQVFKTFIPNNLIIDTAISNDNKYLSYAEIDSSGTLIKSKVKTIDLKDSENDKKLKTINEYEIDNNSLVLNIKYQGNKNLICMCNDGVYTLADGNKNKTINYKENEKNYTFAGIDMFNNIYQVNEITNETQNQYSIVNIYNTATKKQKEYIIRNIAKSTYSSGDTIAINTGTEVYFINTRGWLKKKYVSTQEIRSLKMSDRAAAIIYKDKIEILVL